MDNSSGPSAGQIKIALVVVAVTLAAILTFTVGRKVLEKLDIVDSKDEKRDQINIAKGETNAWLKGGYRRSSDVLLTDSELSQYCKTLYDSVGYFYDNPENMVAVFKKLKNRSQVSQLVDMFYRLYQKDVFSWLKIKMDTEAQKDAYSQAIKHVLSLK